MQKWMSSPTARKSAWMLLVVFLWTMMGVQPLQAAVETCKDLRAASMPQCRDLTDKEMAAIVGGDTLPPIPGDSPWINVSPGEKGAGRGGGCSSCGSRVNPKVLVNPAGGNILVTQPIDLFSSGRGPVALTLYTNTANVMDSYSVFGQKSRLSIYVPLTESPSENPSADIKIAAPNGTMLYFTHDLNSGDWKTSTTASFTGVVNVRCKLVKTGGRYQLSCDGSPSLRELGTVVYKWGAVSAGKAQLNIILVDNDPNTTNDDYKASLEYDGSGKLTCAVDGAGNRTTFDYVPIQIPFQTNIEIGDVQFPGGQRVSFTYVNGGLMGQFNLASVIYPTESGQPPTTVDYTADVNGTISAIRANGASRTFGYWMLSINSVTDELGNKTTWTYPSMSQTQDTVESTPWGSTTTVTQDANSRTPLYVSDALGNRTTFSYDADGRPITKSYKIDGQLCTETYRYDPSALKLASVTYSPSNTSVIYVYNSDKDLQSVTNEMGQTTTSTYDNHRVRVTEDPLHRLTTNVYGSYPGPIATAVTREGGVATTVYSYVDTGVAAGRVKAVTDALGNITTSNYDSNGLVQSVQSSPSGGTVYNTTFSYDSQGRKRFVTNPDVTTVEYWYDCCRAKAEMDENGKTTSTDYWSDGSVMVTTDAAGQATWTSYGYDTVNNKSWKTVTNPAGKATTYTYDLRNLLQKVQYADGTSQVFTYDESGNRKTDTAQNGQVTSYSYDTRGRLTQIAYPNDTAVQYTHDGTGRRLSMTDASGTTSYAYNSDGSLKEVATSFTGSGFGAQRVTYTYYADGLRQSVQQPGGYTTYHYDADGRVSWLTSPYSEKATFTYDGMGRLMKKALDNGAHTSYCYNSRSWLTDIENIKRDGSTVLCSFSYSWTNGGSTDSVGNTLKAVQKLSDGNTYTSTYTYDDAYRMTYEGRTGPSGYGYTYTYDSMGNRLTQAVTGDGRTTYAYDLNSNNELDTEWSGSTTNTYGYDSRGNTTTKTVSGGGGTTTYVYDDSNRLTRILYPNSTSSVYVYDGDGKRVKKVDNTGFVEYYLYDGSILLETIGSDGSAYARHTNGPGGLVYLRQAGVSYYPACDNLGSVWNLVTLDTNETISAAYTYTAFGNTTASGSVGCPFRYVGTQGYYSDYSDSGLMLLGARYYSPSVGRFMNVDPIRDGLNWYAYVGNRPVEEVDPTGKASNPDHWWEQVNPDYIDWMIAGTVIVGAICLDNKTVRVFHANGTHFDTGLPCGEPGKWGGYQPTWFPGPPPMYGGPKDKWLGCFTKWQQDMMKCSEGPPRRSPAVLRERRGGLSAASGSTRGMAERYPSSHR